MFTKVYIVLYTIYFGVCIMSCVISVRIPRRLKEKMDLLKGDINWSDEIRRFIEAKVEEYWKLKVLREVRSVIEQLPEVPRGTVTGYVRKDRDSN